MREKDWNEYGGWLLWRVHNKRKNYEMMFKQLHDTPFRYIIHRDKNRAEDGIYLRDEFMQDTGIYIDSSKDCSVLEMLVALAIRIDNEYIGDPGKERPEVIFWQMLKNLGLHKFPDNVSNPKKIFDILSIWIDRKFEKDGRGSIFPIKNPDENQVEIEIWSQMLSYLSKTYNQK